MDTLNEHLSNKYLSFTMNDEVFALDIVRVREVLDMDKITKIPKSPSYMRGVVNLRGNAIPVMDLKSKFGLGITKTTINTRIIIIEIVHNYEYEIAGIMADSVREVLELDPEQIDDPPKMGASVDTEYLMGVAKRSEEFILVLELSNIIKQDHLGKVIEDMPSTSIKHDYEKQQVENTP